MMIWQLHRFLDTLSQGPSLSAVIKFMTGQLLLVDVQFGGPDHMQVLPLSQAQLSSLQKPTPKRHSKKSTPKPDSTPGFSICPFFELIHYNPMRLSSKSQTERAI